MPLQQPPPESQDLQNEVNQLDEGGQTGQNDQNWRRDVPLERAVEGLDRPNGDDSESSEADEETVQQAAMQATKLSRAFKSHQKVIHRAYEFTQSERLNTSNHQNLSLRYGELNKEWEESRIVYRKLIKLVDDHMVQSYDDCFYIMEEEYFDASSALGTKIDTLERQVKSASQPASEVGNNLEQTQIKVVMPVHTVQNTWGKFDGNRRKWLGFRDRFVAAVHNNENVDEAFKLMHLVGSMTGAAANVLGERQETGDSYKDAWDRIIAKYDKPYLIARDYMSDFYALPVLHSPVSANDLENMSNKTHEVIRQLRALKYPVEHWDFVLVHGLHERLDDATAKEWEKERNGKDMPTVTEMLEFLDKEAAASKRTRGPREGMSISVGNEYALERAKEVNRLGKKTGAFSKTYPCEACPPASGETHPIFKCPNFLALSPYARKDFAMRRKLCLNCLKKGHGRNECGDPRRCSYVQCRSDPMHNSLLCPHKPSGQFSANHGAVGGQSA